MPIDESSAEKQANAKNQANVTDVPGRRANLEQTVEILDPADPERDRVKKQAHMSYHYGEERIVENQREHPQPFG